jgi:hypothetical protein
VYNGEGKDNKNNINNDDNENTAMISAVAE